MCGYISYSHEITWLPLKLGLSLISGQSGQTVLHKISYIVSLSSVYTNGDTFAAACALDRLI
jgi:hypothetical protein